MFQGPNPKIDKIRLDFEMNAPTGMVGRHMSRIGDLILSGAQALVGVKSGKLKRSLYKKHKRTSRGQYVQVGSNVRYAHAHHEGVAAHVIEPTGSGRVLRFRSGGQIIYAKRVVNPGYRGRKYLTVPLKRVVR